MKRLLTSLLCTLSLCSFAQNDSVSLGSGATNMVFYKLTTGAKTSAPNDDWHIAFSARYINGFTFALTSQAAAIRINEAFGLKLFRSPNQKLDQYASFDTTGWHGWQQMHNPDTTWTLGALNANVNFNDPNHFNYGWGEYDGTSHNVTGDSSIYLIQLPDGSFKKFVVLNLLYDTAFNVQYANLDNSGATTQEIRKAPYSSKNFVYLNLSTGNLLDKEPALTDWDFMALRYTNTVYNPSNPTQDIGFLTKDANSEYAASGGAAQQNCYTGPGWTNLINVIGKSWMGAPGDTVIPGQAYFIQNSTSGYKMTVTGFGGATTGLINFSLSPCALSTGISELNASADLSIYPVPASDIINIKINSAEESQSDVHLLDMSGRVILSQNVNTQAGENNFPVNISSIQTGNYIVSVSSAAGRVNRMIAVIK